MRITTGAMTLSTATKNLDLCNTFQVFSDIGDISEEYTPVADSYRVRWTDNCTDGSCGIQASSSFAEGISEATGGKSDRMDITMFAQYVNGSTTETNPFAGTTLVLDVTQMTMDFRKPGSDAVLATCIFYPYQLGDVLLTTAPIK